MKDNVADQPVWRSNVAIWERLAAEHDSTFPLEPMGLSGWLSKSDRILDFGCGPGRTLAWLQGLGYSELVGWDASPAMCQRARERVPGARVVPIDGAPLLPEGPPEFDVVLAVGVLSSVVPEVQRRAWVRGFAGLLRPGGRLIVGDFGRSGDSQYLHRYSEGFEPGTFRTAEGLWIHHFELEECAELLRSHFSLPYLASTSAKTIHGNSIPGHIAVGIVERAPCLA